ncbi:MAG TPA: alanine--tRNA ligase, partial [bacterium]|nr:alanine--tRNA ligase [bacterium]
HAFLRGGGAVVIAFFEAEAIWKKVTGFGTDKILRFGEKENFWSMGETGPCGPCSEIHFDQGKELSCGRPDCGVNCPSDVCDRYLEIWNNVFMQFDKATMKPLPKPSIDTGMGLERITSILQGKKSNYDIDLFQGIIHTISDIAKKKYSGALDASPTQKAIDASLRVVADHARATAFLIGDTILPSNEGRGYVLRRIMRRAIRHCVRLEIDKPRLDEVVGRVIDEMGSAYPELVEKKASVMQATMQEDRRFRETLDTGMKLLAEAAKKVKGSGGTRIPGDVAFQLHDTYGFPLDLTRVMSSEDFGLGVDEEGFEKLMAEQKERGKASWKGAADGGAKAKMIDAAAQAPALKTDLPLVSSVEGLREMPETDRKLPANAKDLLSQAGIQDLADDFARWALSDKCETLNARSRVLATVAPDGNAHTPLKAGDRGAIVAWWSPFYPEGGGQVGDLGMLVGENGAEFEVEDTQKIPGESALPPIHFGTVRKGTFKAGDTVELKVRDEHRTPTRAHHSATHLMHAALRHILGTHVGQKGSLVEPNRLRFDFSHTQPVTRDEQRRIEREVNDAIFKNLPSRHREMKYPDAIAAGALAFFGDKYGERVRVLTIGDPKHPYSVELCGGTHVHNTGEIGLFRITSEEGIAAGVRRLEAVTNGAALDYAHAQEDLLRRSADSLKVASTAVPEAVEKLLEERKGYLKEIEKLRGQIASAGAGDLAAKARDVKGVKVVSAIVEMADPNGLREYAEKLRDKLGSGVVVLGAKNAEGKATLIAAVSKDLTGRVKAGDLIKALAPVVGGKGGGKPDMAQGGGPDVAKLDAAIDQAYSLIP